jgi:hypothetical protein
MITTLEIIQTPLPHLPDELWLLILGEAGVSGWKQARQTCQRFNTLATPLLFIKVYFELCGQGYKSLLNISRHSTLSACVKTLVLRRVRGCREFPDSETWAQSTHQPGDPGHDLALLHEAAYYKNKELSNQLMPYAEWIALSEEQRETLWHEYNADRKQQQKEIRDITDTLRFRTLSVTDNKFYNLYANYKSYSPRNSGR